jgi:hypothetical protein
MNQKKTLEEVRRPNIFGKSWKQDMEILLELRKGINYIIFASVKGNTHIIPEIKLKEMLQEARTQAIEECKRNNLIKSHEKD